MTPTPTDQLLNPHRWQPHVDEPFRFHTQYLDGVNQRDLLISIVDGDILFLDDPRDGGIMVGFVLRGCEDTLLANLNFGIDEDLADPGVWLAHDHVDWFRRDGEEKPGGNLMTLLDAIARDRLVGLVDEGEGGIVAYLFVDREAEVKRILNRTGDPTGMFGKLSQLGDIYPTAEWGGDGPKPKATHWYWSSGNQWCAVVDEWETRWWEGATPEDIAARPERWALPIWDLPPSGLLCFNVKEHEYQQVNIEPAPVTSRVEIPVEFIAHYEDGKITDWVVLPLASHAGHFGPPAVLREGDQNLDITDTDGPFWRAVQAEVGAPITVRWEE